MFYRSQDFLLLPFQGTPMETSKGFRVGLLAKPRLQSRRKVTVFVSFCLPVDTRRPLNYLEKSLAQLATPERHLFTLADFRGLLPDLSEGALRRWWAGVRRQACCAACVTGFISFRELIKTQGCRSIDQRPVCAPIASIV